MDARSFPEKRQTESTSTLVSSPVETVDRTPEIPAPQDSTETTLCETHILPLRKHSRSPSPIASAQERISTTEGLAMSSIESPSASVSSITCNHWKPYLGVFTQYISSIRSPKNSTVLEVRKELKGIVKRQEEFSEELAVYEGMDVVLDASSSVSADDEAGAVTKSGAEVQVAEEEDGMVEFEDLSVRRYIYLEYI
ncbi:hypothetical protein DFQ30_006520 [Apophysomyces sp. BC1015]|nr:hypothetical protein DFQ30_006520 [Apophysomyces sp. BC1015]